MPRYAVRRALMISALAGGLLVAAVWTLLVYAAVTSPTTTDAWPTRLATALGRAWFAAEQTASDVRDATANAVSRWRAPHPNNPLSPQDGGVLPPPADRHHHADQ